MECKERFVFKTIEKRGAGAFKNEKGETVEYPEAYILKVDENKDGKINERKFRISSNRAYLADKLREVAPYEDIDVTFDVLVHLNGVRLEVLDVEMV